MKVIVIGGGIHGITVAIELARKGFAVTVVEKNHDILSGTSGATHNRAHLGYHYPRSVETAEECINGLRYFEKVYPEALYYPNENYYVIEKHDSKTTTIDFIKFCNSQGIPFKKKWPPQKYLNRQNIDCSFLVPEGNFNLFMLSLLLKQHAKEMNVNILLGHEMTNVLSVKENSFSLLVKRDSDNCELRLKSNFVINATWSETNRIQFKFGCKEPKTKYKLQTTEVGVAKYNGTLPSLTVMDGKFISIVPLVSNKDNLYLIYDAKNSVTDEFIGFFPKTKMKKKSNLDLMIKHGEKYFPFMREMSYIDSLWGTRPIPISITDDSRTTRLLYHKSVPGLLSILEGKFISAPLIAKEIANLIK